MTVACWHVLQLPPESISIRPSVASSEYPGHLLNYCQKQSQNLVEVFHEFRKIDPLPGNLDDQDGARLQDRPGY